MISNGDFIKIHSRGSTLRSNVFYILGQRVHFLEQNIGRSAIILFTGYLTSYNCRVDHFIVIQKTPTRTTRLDLRTLGLYINKERRYYVPIRDP